MLLWLAEYLQQYAMALVFKYLTLRAILVMTALAISC